eukprot:CAMPEP_0118673422 /NCGR_PEP_ID=MMETSP0800-20121206/310_1 /TAXON_ID=210618 ORGANISM="Striatella unipunctata, Strain CCMP2910" /NCGR_SAMPLE_ID=MMETSP0800 /ASSEMBLY_ACC=CAM_ASM_000638 /LENGTH=298 /DNA_ID=CAMNT_0006568477 /DNA_START=295 /DNA_END=1191 /DNA_ORIENTATION=-
MNTASKNSGGEDATDGIDEIEMVLPMRRGSHNSSKIEIPRAAETDEDPFDPSTFRARLEATLATCRELKQSSLWVQVPMSRAGLIEIMSDYGFKYHNAEDDLANLFIWLKTDTECKIPTYATHQVGVGAIVVNSRDEILCVRELRKNYMPWKVPGGLAELGEQLDQAVEREVLEETGIQCEFKSVVAMRHTHNLQFGRSDLYFVCRLQPVESKDPADGTILVPVPVPQAGEIESAAWIPLKEFKEMVYAENGHPMMQHILKLCDQDSETGDIQKSIISSIVPGRKPAPVYHAPLRSLE